MVVFDIVAQCVKKVGLISTKAQQRQRITINYLLQKFTGNLRQVVFFNEVIQLAQAINRFLRHSYRVVYNIRAGPINRPFSRKSNLLREGLSHGEASH